MDNPDRICEGGSKRPNTGYIIVPCYNEEEVLPSSYARLRNAIEDLIEAQAMASDSKILFVDDGSTDKTWELISDYCGKDIYKTIGIRLVGNVGHQNALIAGLDYASEKCDFTVTIDADLQQDINALSEFIRHYQAGADVVYGIRDSRSTDSVLKRLTASLFYKIMRLLGAGIIENHADYRLLSRDACRALLSYSETNLFLRGIITQLGYPSASVSFPVYEREYGKSKYTPKKMFQLASNGITSFSTRPLHFVMMAGVVCVFTSFVMIAFAVVSWFKERTIPGWTSVQCSIWFLCGLLMISIGICGEYIGKIYYETKRRPRYIIQTIIGVQEEEKNKVKM